MSYVRGVRFDSEKGCLSGTREEVLEAITYWVHSDSSRVLWLTGGAGTGKSAIAHTIAARFSFLQRLGSSFFFTRGQAGHDPENLFSTFARNLADLDASFRQTLATAIRRDRALRTTNVRPRQYLWLSAHAFIVPERISPVRKLPLQAEPALFDARACRVCDRRAGRVR